MAAIDSERDFSGKWILDPALSNTQALSEPLERSLTIAQQEASIQCSTSFNGSTAAWSYALNRDETQYHLGVKREAAWSSGKAPLCWSIRLSRNHKITQ